MPLLNTLCFPEKIDNEISDLDWTISTSAIDRGPHQLYKALFTDFTQES